MQPQTNQVRVWDRVVRIGHWFLVASFAIAYFSAEESETVHVVAGYCIAAYLVLRTIWGFVGSEHARFSNFVRGPKAVFAYLADMLRGQPRHYLGHNPAGGAMIVALLLSLSATVLSGLVTQAIDEQEGPLVGLFAAQEPSSSETPVAYEEHESESVYQELHELFANLSLLLIAVHVLGVIAASWLHKENLIRAMVTGKKTLPGPRD